MSRPFTLYYSNFASFESCPQSFLFNKGWNLIDTGGGPGRPKPRPFKKTEHHAVLGTVIQAAIERFYNDMLWNMLSPPVLRDRLIEISEEAFRIEIAKRYIDWRVAPSQDEMRKIIKDGILGYMRTLKAHRLLGVWNKAEMDLVGFVNKYTPVGGRPDVIIRRDEDPCKGITIIDGKNGRRYKDGKGGWMTYTSPDQLRWYAMMFYICYKVLPDRLGFCFYRYPHGAPVLDMEEKPTGETETGVDWIPCSMEDIKGLAQRAVDARKAMDREKFEARPDPKSCRLCDWETVCPQRQEQKASNRRSPRNTDEALDGITGFTKLSM
ncbi:MAG: PD-(D/E)XK nuclease family protein [Bacteroidota bacterium]